MGKGQNRRKATHQRIEAVQVDGSSSNFNELNQQPVGLPHSPSHPHALLSGFESLTTTPPDVSTAGPQFMSKMVYQCPSPSGTITPPSNAIGSTETANLSHGEMKKADGLVEQDSPGALNGSGTSGSDYPRETIEEIAVASIIHCTDIPDYIRPTHSPHPTVVATPQGHYCIDGWDLIEGAKIVGQQYVCCHIYTIQEHSTAELAILKMAIRIRPQSGKSLYAELIRNASLVFDILANSRENPILFFHGGARQSGTNRNENREDDVLAMMERRLDKSIKTINQYRNHGRHLTSELMDALIESRAGKSFFEEAQTNKRKWIRHLEETSQPDQIAAIISSKMAQWYDEFQRNGKIGPDQPQVSAEENNGMSLTPEGTPTQENASAASQAKTLKVFEHRSPSPPDQSFDRISEDTIRADIQSHIALMNELLVAFEAAHALQIVEQQIVQLASIRQKLLQIHDDSGIEKEVA